MRLSCKDERGDTHLCDEVDDVVLGADLHSDGEVSSGIGREEHLDRALLEGLLASRTADFKHMKLREKKKTMNDHDSRTKTERYLAAVNSAVSNDKEGRWRGVSGHLELCEGSRVAIQRLRELLLHRVQLHLSDNTAVNSGDADQNGPLEVGIGAVVDDLRASKVCVAVEQLDRILTTYSQMSK